MLAPRVRIDFIGCSISLHSARSHQLLDTARICLLAAVLATTLGAPVSTVSARPDSPGDVASGEHPASPMQEVVGSWNEVAPMNSARHGHFAAALPDGSVLVVGSGGDETAAPVIASYEVYSPGTDTWTSAPLDPPRRRFCGTTLTDGRVLIAGGDDGPNGEFVSRALMYDPAAAAWSPAGDVVVPREHCTLTALPGGGALLVGGGDRAWLDSIESFDPGTATWTRVGALNEAREFHTATLVGDEAVLVAGGAGSTGRLASIERIDLATFQSTSIAEFQTARAFHTATTLNDGRVLYAGGDGGSGQGFPERAELFDPSTGRIAPGPAMVEPRRHHAAMRLSDGRILIVGGDQNRPLRSTEIFHPAAEEWRAGPELLEPRGWHQLVSLLDGRPFITGGRGATGPLLSAGFFALRAGDSDLIVGDFIGDDGTVPSQTTDPMWLSPDIRVCDTPIEDYDPAPFSTGSPPAWWPDDPESLPNTDKNYCASTAEYRDPLMSAPNYVYVRVKNEGTGNSDGDEVLKIYWAKAGTSLSWPDHWGGTIGADTESTDDYMANTCSPDGVTDFQYGSQITKPRRDASEVPAATRDAFVQAVLDIADASQFGWDQPGNNTVSFWHMQNVIHFMGSNAGWHGDRSFLPWHREFIDRFERLLQQSNPSLKLLYWDWSKPIGGLLTPTFMGSSGTPSDPFWPVSGLGLGCPSGCAVVGPEVERFTGTFSSPSNPTDVDDIVGQNDFIDYPIGPGNNCTFVPGATTGFSNLLEKGHCEFSGGSWVLAYGPHDKGHVFIGAGGGSGDPGMGNILRSPQDPIFFLHHGNVDRLWAHWQRSGGPSRISTSTAYGTGTTAMSNEDLGPWAGIGSNLRLQPDSSDTSSGAGPGGGGPEPGEDDVQPWTSDATYGGQIRAKSAADASIVLPPVYDTALLTVPELAAGQSAVLAVPWYPPDPDNYTGGGCTQQNHFCLLARLETSENTGNAFGMNSPEGSSVWNNTRDNNNVAWRNIAVSKSPTGILVGSAFSETVETQFLLTGPEDPGKRLTQIGRVFVELGGGLLERWQDAGAAGRGVRWVEGTNTIEVLEPQASLDGIMLEPGDRFPISMDYELAAGYAPPVGDEIPWLDIVQLGAPGDPTAIVGGVRIQADIRRLELVGQGGRWWYVPEGAAPDAGWTNPDYDDSSWREGEADLGFGLRPMTVIANGHSGPGGNTAYYFRRAFEFADPSIVQSLWLHLKRDDGAIVYLNGTEIHRSNMPAGSIDHGTLAEREVSGIEQETFYPISATHAIDLLRPGRNVVAVEVHQSAPESTDLVFDLALYANPVDPRVGPSIGFRTPADGSEFQLGNSIPVEVEAIDADGEVREVEVVVGEEPIAALPSAPYTFEWDDPPLGTHRLRAVAEDNDGLVSTAYQTVVVVENTKPHVSLVEPAVGASFSEGETITLVAEASDPGGAIERVEFLSIDMAGWFTDGSRLLDSVESPPYTTDVSDLPVGMHMLSAVAYDDRGATMQSDLVHVMVSANDSTRLFLPIAFSMVDVGDDGNTSPTGGGGGVSGSVYYAAQEASDDGQAIERQVYLPDFEIVLRDLDRGVDSPAIATDLFGRYRFPRQAPGRYELRWNAQSGWQAGAHPDVIEIGDGPAFPVPARVEPTPRVGTIFGSVSLGDGSSPWFSDPYFSIDHTASVTILDAARTTTLAGPIRVNSTGRFAVSGLPAGELLTVRAQSEASILTRTVPEANVSTGAPAPAVQLELGNRRPEIVSVTAYVDDEPVKTVEPGASIQLVPSTRDVDGDRLTHTWQDVTGNGVVLPADDGTATWQLPGEAGRYRAYLVVADGGGGFARQQVDFTSGMTAERFSGIAVNKSTGDGIEGATVTVGDVTASTDANGFFELAAPLADRYVLNIERVGFATLSRVVDSGLTGQTWSLVAAQSQEVDPRESFELVDERPELERARIRGTRVRIPANALVDSSGRPPTGMLNAQLATLNIAEGEAPGDWAAMLDGQEARLVSYGATYVEFRDGSGASFNLAPEMEAEVIMYPPPSMGGDVPDEAPLWSYDEADGIWRESGDATFDPSEGAYVGTVSHFSTINTDIALTDAACLRVLIYPPIKTGVKIRISDPTSSVFSQSYDFVLDAAINAAYRLPSNTTVKLELLNADGTAYGNPVVLEEQPGVPLGGNQVNTGAAIPAGQTHFPPEPYESCKLVILREPDAPSSNAFLQFKDFNNAADAAQANAYYAAIDPNDERLTLGDWWAENGFVVGTGGFPTNGTRTSYLNYNDLGSGRDMYFLQNTDGTAASYVTNYGDFDQDHSNADLAFNRTSPGATVAMEYGPVTGQGATRIVKFYVYAGGKANAQRVTSANLDGFGEKFIPNLCLNCHGGDYQPSNPAQPTFAEIDMGAAFRELDYATYRFPGGRFVPNATEKAAFKAQNEIVKGLSANDAITIQPVKDLITGWYAAGGDDQDNDWTPAGWSGTAETGLYKDVVRNSCRTCHVGLDNDPGQYGIGWISYDQFKLRRGSMEYYALCDGRQMPHAVTTYRNFWLSANPHQPAILRDFTGPGWSALGACQ